MITPEERTLIAAEVIKRVMIKVKEIVPEDERMEFQLAPAGDRPGVILHFKVKQKPWPAELAEQIRRAIPVLVEAAGPGLEAVERTGLWEGYLAWSIRPRAESKYLSQVGLSKADIRAAIMNLHRSRLAGRIADIFKQMPKKPAVSRSLIKVDWPQQDDTIPV